jgi:hypothetical protein
MDQTLLTDYDVGVNSFWNINNNGVQQGLRQRVIGFFDPTAALPAGPVNGDKYISLATARGWQINSIEYYSLLGWKTITPIVGDLVWFDSLVQYRVWDGANWVPFGSVVNDYIFQNLAFVAGTIPIWTNARNLTVTQVEITNSGTGYKNLHVPGKLTVDGLIDPTGMQFSTQAVVPVDSTDPDSTIWIDNTVNKTLKKGNKNVILYNVGTLADNAVPKFSGASGGLLDSTGVTIDDSDRINVMGISINTTPMITKFSTSYTLIDAPAVVPVDTTIPTQKATYNFVKYNISRISCFTTTDYTIPVTIPATTDYWFELVDLVDEYNIGFDTTTTGLVTLEAGMYHIGGYVKIKLVPLIPALTFWPAVQVTGSITGILYEHTIAYNILQPFIPATFSCDVKISAGELIRLRIFVQGAVAGAGGTLVYAGARFYAHFLGRSNPIV